MIRKLVVPILALMTFAAHSDAMQMTVFDVGAGLCTVTKMSNGDFVVFDAGDKGKGKYCKNKIKRSASSSHPFRSNRGFWGHSVLM